MKIGPFKMKYKKSSFPFKNDNKKEKFQKKIFKLDNLQDKLEFLNEDIFQERITGNKAKRKKKRLEKKIDRKIKKVRKFGAKHSLIENLDEID